jgi:hypothetical protein
MDPQFRQFRQLCKRCTIGRCKDDTRPIIECDGENDGIHCIENLREQTRQYHNGVAVRAADIPDLLTFLFNNPSKNSIHICKYGHNCDYKFCCYYHPLKNYTDHIFDVDVQLVPLIQVTSGKLSSGKIIENKDFLLAANKRLFGVCHYGAGCTNGSKCTFIHVAADQSVSPRSPEMQTVAVTAVQTVAVTAAQTAVVTAPTTSSAWNPISTQVPVTMRAKPTQVPVTILAKSQVAAPTPAAPTKTSSPTSGKTILKAQLQELCEKIAQKKQKVAHIKETVSREEENVKIMAAAYQIKKALCLVR